MSRITKADIDGSLRLLNQNSKRTYMIDRAYGGWKLVVQEKGSCQSDVLFGFGSKSELYYIIQSILRYRSMEAHEPI